MKILKNDKKIFFFDIDGTLAVGKKIPDSTKKAIQLLKNNNDLIFICTGRPYHYVKHYFYEYADGFITSNGRYIIYHDQVLLDEPLTQQQVSYFIQVMRENNCGFVFIGEKHGYLECHDHHHKEQLLQSYFDGYFLTKFRDKDVCGYMFDIYCQSQQHLLDMQKIFKDKVVFNQHYPYFSADATILGVDKGVGIDCVLDYFQIQKENAFAFGDGSNDLCMFKHVGHSIAMGNAIDALKKEAEYVTTSIDQDGVYQALQYYGVID